MITEQERIIRKSQGYDIGFERNDKKYWINSSILNEAKVEQICKEAGLASFQEEYCDCNIVFYDPDYFEVETKYSPRYLTYVGTAKENIPQPLNMSAMPNMFMDRTDLKALDLSDWCIPKVRLLMQTFGGCKNLESINLANWNIASNVASFGVFEFCKNLEFINFKNSNLPKMLDTSEDKMVFVGCEKLYKKYNTANYAEIMQKIIEDSNKGLEQLKAF